MKSQNVVLRERRAELTEKAEQIMNRASDESRALNGLEGATVSRLIYEAERIGEEIVAIEAAYDRERNLPAVYTSGGAY